jgi:hypothetical protein
MSRILLAILVIICCASEMMAQDKARFKSINQVGLLVGASRSAFQVQSVNGVSYRGYTMGVGVGMDNYYFKTIPVFVDVRKNIFPKKASPFVYGDVGASLPQDREVLVNYGQHSNYARGLYYDIGIGYTSPIWKVVGMTVSLGYSGKEMKETRSYRYPGADGRQEFYDYSFRRLSLKLGFDF